MRIWGMQSILQMRIGVVGTAWVCAGTSKNPHKRPSNSLRMLLHG